MFEALNNPHEIKAKEKLSRLLGEKIPGVKPSHITLSPVISDGQNKTTIYFTNLPIHPLSHAHLDIIYQGLRDALELKKEIGSEIIGWDDHSQSVTLNTTLEQLSKFDETIFANVIEEMKIKGSERGRPERTDPSRVRLRTL